MKNPNIISIFHTIPPVRPVLRHILALLDSNRGFNRGVLRGIRRFTRGRPDWIFRAASPQTTKASLIRWKPDGVIAQLGSGRLLRAVRSQGVPSVLVLQDRCRWCPIVDIDEEAVGKIAARDFLNRGFRELAFLGVDGEPWSRLREKGFTSTVAEAGYHPRTYHVEYGLYSRRVHGSIIDIGKQLHTWLEQLPKPVGIFAVNDFWAREIAEACLLSGIHVPEQAAIVGVDNDEFICEMGQPELSSVAIPWEKIGYEAASQLNGILTGNKVPETRTLLIPPGEIVTRHSSDVVAVTNTELARALGFISQHACDPIDVSDVLRAVPLDRRWLERQCQIVLGRSPLKEIQRVRMLRARELLSSTDLPVSTIAERCGVSEKKFSMTFRKDTGTTPIQWRRRFRA